MWPWRKRRIPHRFSTVVHERHGAVLVIELGGDNWFKSFGPIRDVIRDSKPRLVIVDLRPVSDDTYAHVTVRGAAFCGFLYKLTVVARQVDEDSHLRVLAISGMAAKINQVFQVDPVSSLSPYFGGRVHEDLEFGLSPEPPWPGDGQGASGMVD